MLNCSVLCLDVVDGFSHVDGLISVMVSRHIGILFLAHFDFLRNLNTEIKH